MKDVDFSSQAAPMQRPSNLSATVFVFRHQKSQQIQCEYLDIAKQLENSPDWEQIATIEPRTWIQRYWSLNTGSDTRIPEISASGQPS